MIISQLEVLDIPGLNGLPPIDWRFNYEGFLKEFLPEKYFHAFVLKEKGQIIGTGNVLLKNGVGWLANIIIKEDFRGKGLGFRMTSFLVDFLKRKNCKTQLLLATKLGLPVYEKVGFKKITYYRCFDTNVKLFYKPSEAVSRLKKEDLVLVHQLDQQINGENRVHLIRKFFENALGFYDHNKLLLGAYLPKFGRGLVLAKSEMAGLELLKIKHAKTFQRTLLPIENKIGIDFFEKYRSTEGPTLAKMVLGKELPWKPEQIYSYASGYCG